MRISTLKIEKFIYMADGFYVYKMEDGYAVKDQFGYTLKTAKTVKTCENYVQKQLESRRAAERYAIEKINRDRINSNDSST
jgi:hypothetical protein